MRCELKDKKLYPVPAKDIYGTKWGYINDVGYLKIKPKYDTAGYFYKNKIAIVSKDGLYGIIDFNGNYILEPKYDSISDFSQNRAIAIIKDGFCVINEKGDIITKKYSYIGTYVDGRALFEVTYDNNKWLYGYLSLDGNEIIPAKYENASDFKNGKAIVKQKKNEYKLIDLDGDIINTYSYAIVENIGDGFLAFKENINGKFGFIDETGKVIIPPKYSSVTSFQNGRSIVNLSENYGNQYGLIDKKGRFLIEPKYNNINFLGEDRISVGIPLDKDKPYIGSMYALSDLNGNFITYFLYYQVYNYQDVVASCCNENTTFFIGKDGKLVRTLPILKGNGIMFILESLIRADVDYRVSYFNKNGKLIWTQNKYICLNSNYLIQERKSSPNRDYLVYYPEILGITNKNVNEILERLSNVKHISNEIQLEYNYLGDFEVEFFKDRLLVLELSGYKYYFGAAHGMESKIYAHIDLISGEFYQLKDLFKHGSNYIKVISDIIENQIKNDEKYSYIWIDDYKGIKENQPFYVDANNLYIFFYPYAIAPYAAGFPTFKIPFKEIMDIVNTREDFWKSFNEN